LKQRYAQEREIQRISVTLKNGQKISLSPGGQNVLIEKIINDFCELFTPGGKLIYVGDTGDKWGYFDRESLEALGITADAHGKMPDVVVHYVQKNWLVLVEATTSHGPVTPKRRNELQAVFQNSTAGLVFVTAFNHRSDMAKYLNEIAWETEVWVADAPTHIIHFNGDRFLGPYP
jgi:type II restriction enzyme